MVLVEEVDLRLTGVGKGMVPVCWEVGLICIALKPCPNFVQSLALEAWGAEVGQSFAELEARALLN